MREARANQSAVEPSAYTPQSHWGDCNRDLIYLTQIHAQSEMRIAREQQCRIKK